MMKRRILPPVVALLLVFGGCEGPGFRQGIEDLTLGLGNWVYKDVVDAGVNAEFNEYFGSSVAMSGDWAIIGALGNGDLTGAAYFFYREGESWTLKQLINGTDTGDRFGISVDICMVSDSEGYAVIGADGATGGGAAYLYSLSGSSWTLEMELDRSTYVVTGDNYGRSVTVDRNWLAIGAPGTDSDNGQIYLFFNNAGTWVASVILDTDDIGSELGYSLAITDNYLAAGGMEADSGKGAVYIYHRNGSAWGDSARETWKVAPSSLTAEDNFGKTVDMSDLRIIAGAPGDTGRAFVLDYSFSDDSWQESELITEAGSRDIADVFGSAVSVSEDYVVVGARSADSGAANTGAAFFFENTDETWKHRNTVIETSVSTGTADNQFGVSACLRGETAMIGSMYGDDGIENGGSLFIYRREVLD